MNPTYRLRCTVFLGAVLCAVQGNRSQAAPTGGTVVAGQGTISQTGNTTTVQQQTQSLSLDWLSFNIAPSETVRFVQPSSTAVALNRVVGNDPSQIYGHLQANGQVFLINPNGVLFGSTAQVNVGGLVASSLNLTDADFLNGRYKFQSTASGSGEGSTAGSGSASTPATVVNEGVINASAGSSIALLGGQVSNRGIITAQLGTVALAAGSAITLEFGGNRLLTVQVDQGAAGALVENRQLIKADGGKVIMTAAARDSLLNTVVNNTGVIEARTIQNEGGEITLLGGADGGTVSVGGTLDASAPKGGDGGTIETSGAYVHVADSAHISTAAAAGKTGTWLVDPTDFTVTPSGGDISGATLSSELASTNVTLSTTTGKVSGNGDLFFDDTVKWTANTTLTLNAARNIVINSSMSGTGNTAGVSLNFGGDYSLNYGSSITLSGSTPSLSINGQSYTVINSLGVAGDTSSTTLQGMNNNLSGHYALGSDINASPSGGFSGGGFVPIGNGTQMFTGTLAGLGHAIKDLTVNPNSSPGGLIAYAGTGSVIRDVGINGGKDASTSSNFYTDIGALVGVNYGNIVNAYAIGVTVSGENLVGGLVGENYGSITNSYSNGTVTGSGDVGGLVGHNNGGTIDQSHATGSSAGNEYVGGLVGGNDADSSIRNSYATGNVAAQGNFGQLAGGLVGGNDGTISGSYATGNVTATNSNTIAWTGGLVGFNADLGTISNSYYFNPTGQVNAGSLDDVGGLVGFNAGSVAQSYATTHVIGGNSVGGLIGQNVQMQFAGAGAAALTRSYATGSVSGSGSGIGGLIGTNSSVNITDCYTAASVSGSGSNIGGFIGSANGGTITSSYWIASGSTTDASGAVALTTAQAEQPSSYANWDFSTIWRIYDGHTAPLLKTFLTPLTVTAGNISTTYNGQSYSGGLSNPTYSVSGAATSGHLQGLTTAYAGDRNAGTYAPPDLWSDQQGYDISLVGGTLTINKAPLIVTTSDVTKIYDGTTSAAGSPTIRSGTIFGSDTLTGGTFAFTDRNAGSDKTVSAGGVTVSDGNGGNNYSVTYVNNTTSTINPAVLTVSGATAANKTYDGSAAASVSGGSLSGVLGSDSVGLLQGGSFNDKNAGTNKPVQELFGLTGNDAPNYVLASNTAQTTANITPAALTITANNATKVAGSANPALAVTYSGFVSGDSASSLTTAPTASTTATTTSPAGSYAITVSGAANPNYTFTYAPGTLTVTDNPATGSPAYIGAVSSVTQLPSITVDTGSPKSKSDDTELYDGMLDIDTPKRVADALPILSLIILDKGIKLPQGVQ